MRSEENGKLESKLNVSVISGGQISKRSDKDEDRSLSFRCTQCVLDSFELNYGPLTSECKAEVLKRPVSFMWKHFFDYWASFLIITPCVISFWRGTWDYANIYLDKVAFKVGGLFSSLLSRCCHLATLLSRKIAPHAEEAPFVVKELNQYKNKKARVQTFFHTFEVK